jgi:hypothetical protein
MENQDERKTAIMSIIGNINSTVKGILLEDLPKHLQMNEETVDTLLKHLCVTSFTLGYIVRIDSILSYRKLSVFSTVCFLALTMIITYTLLTNA